MKKINFYVIALFFFFGLAIGILIGYNTNPYSVFECFGKLGYQNITCYQEGNDYHCITQEGKGYRIENAVVG